jgi:hypothetical protein
MKKILFPIITVALFACSKEDMPKPAMKDGMKARCNKHQNKESDTNTNTSTNENGRIGIIHNFGGGGCGCGSTHNPPPRPVENNQVKGD